MFVPVAVGKMKAKVVKGCVPPKCLRHRGYLIIILKVVPVKYGSTGACLFLGIIASISIPPQFVDQLVDRTHIIIAVNQHNRHRMIATFDSYAWCFE